MGGMAAVLPFGCSSSGVDGTMTSDASASALSAMPAFALCPFAPPSFHVNTVTAANAASALGGRGVESGEPAWGDEEESIEKRGADSKTVTTVCKGAADDRSESLSEDEAGAGECAVSSSSVAAAAVVAVVATVAAAVVAGGGGDVGGGGVVVVVGADLAVTRAGKSSSDEWLFLGEDGCFFGEGKCSNTASSHASDFPGSFFSSTGCSERSLAIRLYS